MLESTAVAPCDTVRWNDTRTPSGITIRACEPLAPGGHRGPPLLLLHGLAGGAWYWDRFQRVLAERGHPSYAPNLRGHHGSRPVAALGRVSLANYVADSLESARHVGHLEAGKGPVLDGRPVVIGHSLGGLLAQALAAADAVSAAVLLCPMPPAGIGFVTPRLMLRQLRHLGAMLLSRPLRGTPSDMIATTLNRIPTADQPALAARFVADSGRVARELSRGGLPIAPERVRVPMLVVSATEDRFFSPRVGAMVAARYGAEHTIYEDHAHFLVQEPGAESIAGDIADWIGRIGR
ncbi:MAG: alpha/beta hydrolase [Gemmatimonadaceae bacterium]